MKLTYLKYCEDCKITEENHTCKEVEVKKDTWTITVEMTVFAGDMDKDNVISNAEDILTNMTDGSDIASFTVVDAKRDE